MNEHLIYQTEIEYWKDVYKNKIRFLSKNNSTAIPWEIETVDPNLPKLLDRFSLNSGKLLELGCGKGVDANYLCQRGFQVTAIDVSEDVIAIAKQNNCELDIEFYSADFFVGIPRQKFDIVYDRGFLHNFKTRMSIIFEKVSFMLNDQGKYIFITGNPNQPAIQSCVPPPVFLSEIEQASSQWFKIISVEEITFKVNENYLDSLGYIWYLEKR
jgi:SAM-dependent methyltransferase